MFRRQQVVVVPGRTQYVTARTDITEHRAPTDESVKLLREMEKAADDRRIETLTLEDNAFHGKVFIERQHYDNSIVARCAFDLNGHRITVDEKLDLLASSNEQSLKIDLLMKLRDKIALRIASEVLTEFSRGGLLK